MHVTLLLEGEMSNEEKDLAFIRDPNKWPHWPRLPLVHKTRRFSDQGRYGTLLATGQPTVYLGTMYEDLSKAETEKYSSFEELVRDWGVD